MHLRFDIILFLLFALCVQLLHAFSQVVDLHHYSLELLALPLHRKLQLLRDRINCLFVSILLLLLLERVRCPYL